MLTMSVHAIGNLEGLQCTKALLTHFAPLPAALNERLAPGLQPGPHGMRAHRVQLSFLCREMGLACLKLALGGGKLRTELYFRFDEAEGGSRRRGRQ